MNSHSPKFAQHLNEHAHFFRSINDMKVLHYHKKGTHVNTIERFYIQVEYTSNNHLNDSHTTFPNRIFDNLLRTYHP